MSEERVPLLSPGDALAAAERAGVPDALAELSVFRVLLRRERPAKAMSDLLLALLFRGELDTRLRELVIMRIGWATGSVYEWTQHWRIARDLEVSADDLLAVRDWSAHDRFSELDRAVLSATDEVLTTGAVTRETLVRLRGQLGDDVALELVMAIATWTMISTLLRSLDVPLEDGVEPWPPDGARPPAPS